jgi:hypothetical protein
MSKLLKYSMFGVAFALTVLTVTGCITDEKFMEPETPDGPDDDGKVRLELFTRTPDYERPTTMTRAGVANEVAIDKTPWVLVFSGTGDGATYAEVSQAYLMGAKTYIDLTPRTTAARLLVLANPEAKFTDAAGTEYDFSAANFNVLLTGKTIAQAAAILHTRSLANPQTTVPFASTTAANQKPLPMSAVIDVASINNSTPITIDLERALARVVVTNSASNFTLQGVTVMDAPRRGRLWQNGTTLKSNTAAAERTDYTEFVAATAEGSTQTTDPTTETAKNPIYLYESAKEEATHTQIIIQGTYNGALNYYRLSFRNPTAAGTATPNATLDILRNRNYTFKISAVKRAGYTTLADAQNAAHASNEDIVWGIDVTDATAHDIIDNGEYYLGVTNSRLILYADGAQTNILATIASTNCTIAPTDNSITVSGTGLSLTTAGQKIKLDGTLTEVRLNMTAAFTAGDVTLRLGNITHVIEVMRNPAWSASQSKLSFPGSYVSAEVESGSDWLKLSTSVSVNQQQSYLNIPGGGAVYVYPEVNSGSIRRGTIWMSILDQGRDTRRTRVEIVQNPQ